MNTSCWEAGGWTVLVGGNPTERIGRSRVNDIEGKAARVVASECGERASFKRIYANGRKLSPFGLCTCFPRFRRRRRLKCSGNNCSAREPRSVPIIEKRFAREAKLNGAIG